MNAKNTISHETFRPARLAAVIATLALGASASCFAAVDGAGEAQGVALPVPMAAMTAPASQTGDAGIATVAGGTGSSSGITREQVRSDLMAARENGTMAVAGEIGDNSRTVLAARDRANEAQAESIMAQYRIEQETTVALQQAEELRASIEAQGALDSALASAGYGGEEEAYVPSGSGDQPVDTSSVRIDVIRMSPELGAVKPEDELVVVAVEGGDETSQLERAAAIRRQLGEMGLSQDQVYIEAVPERD